jgi:hypothetical protein
MMLSNRRLLPTGVDASAAVKCRYDSVDTWGTDKRRSIDMNATDRSQYGLTFFRKKLIYFQVFLKQPKNHTLPFNKILSLQLLSYSDSDVFLKLLRDSGKASSKCLDYVHVHVE